jgi:hypothetical protein
MPTIGRVPGIAGSSRAGKNQIATYDILVFFEIAASEPRYIAVRGLLQRALCANPRASHRQDPIMLKSILPIAVALVFDTLPLQAQDSSVHFQQFDVPNSASTEVDGINARGEIVGFSFDQAGE